MDEQQKEQIRELMRLRRQALTAVYLDNAEVMINLELDIVKKILQKSRYTIMEYGGITEDILMQYAEGLNAGGTLCVERVLTPITSGKNKGRFSATTRQMFVPWLDDMEKQDAADIIRIIQDGERNMLNPNDIARQLSEKFADTYHNAVTAARTEAQKIRSDARSRMFERQGVEYVQYVTAGDDAVRPEHALRDGKIYRHEDAPMLGEYNCRCVLVPADYKVYLKGAEVTKSESEVVDG